MTPTSPFVLTHLAEIATLSPLVQGQRFTQIADKDLGRIKDGWIAVANGRIIETGSGSIAPEFQTWTEVDCHGGIAVPGLIDAHTHPLFAGSRANEFCMRLDGKTYQEIASAGGGIQSTVKSTKEATDDELENLLRQRLSVFASHGVTTVEVKSGYGLSIKEELRHLKILRKVALSSPMTLYVTCLALHAVPRDMPSARAWSEACAKDLLPEVARLKLADAVDAFIEAGYFSSEDCTPYFDAAQKLGLGIRVHADEFSNAAAASEAAKYHAESADHLQFASSEGIRAMAKANVTALLLPGTSLYTSIPYTNARPFIEAGCAVGLATDYNPGSCPVDNLRLVLTMGALHCKLSMAEAIAAITWVPARSLKLQKSKGALTAGMDADILVMPLPTLEDFVADLGRTKPLAVYAKGSRL